MGHETHKDKKIMRNSDPNYTPQQKKKAMNEANLRAGGKVLGDVGKTMGDFKNGNYGDMAKRGLSLHGPGARNRGQNLKTQAYENALHNQQPQGTNSGSDWASPDNSSGNDWRSPEAAMTGSRGIHNNNNVGNNNAYHIPKSADSLNSSEDSDNNQNNGRHYRDAKDARKHNSVLNGAKRALKNPLKHDLGGAFKSNDLGIHSGSANPLKNAKGQIDRAGGKEPTGTKSPLGKGLKGGLKGTAEGHPILTAFGIWYLWHAARQTAHTVANGLLNAFPILNKLVPMLKDVDAFVKGAAKGIGGMLGNGAKLLGHGLGKVGGGIFHGLGALGRGAGHLAHGLAHAITHPVAAGASALHAATHVGAAGTAATAHLSVSGISKVALASVAGISLIGAGDYMFHSRTGGNLQCAVQQIKQDTTDSISGTSGEWTKKGTKAYNMAKATYAAAKAQGCDDEHAAAVTGNAAHESGMFAHGLSVHQFSGGHGVGIFQFNDPPKDMSPSGQVKAIFANAPGRKNGWEKSSGSISSLTNSFEEIFERGGIPDNGLRDKLANRAYSMFKGVGGKTSAADENDASASAGAKGACQKGNNSDSGNDSDVVKFAQRYLGLKYQLGGNPIPISEGKPKSDVDPTDCNKFAWAVEKGSGHAVPSNEPGNCDDSISRLHKYEVSPSKAHAGSLVINHYHAMVMMTPWRGLKGTKLIQEGGGGGDVNEGHSYYWSMASYLGSTRHFFNIPKK